MIMTMNMIFDRSLRKERGVTLLIAIVVLSATLSIALGIAFIMFIQLSINRGARESYKALYSADAGKECFLYYLNRVGPPDQRGFWDSQFPCVDGDCSGEVVECAGGSWPITTTVNTDPVSGNDEHHFRFRIDTEAAGQSKPHVCVEVEVVSEVVSIGGKDWFQSVSLARGESECGAGLFKVNRTIETCIIEEPSGQCI